MESSLENQIGMALHDILYHDESKDDDFDDELDEEFDDDDDD